MQNFDFGCGVKIMSNQRKVICFMSLIFLGLLVGMVCLWADINPPEDRIKDKSSESVFFCNNSNNHIDIQTGSNCASYATAYVLRSLGEQTDGEDIIPEMNRIFGFVPAKSIIQVLKNHGYVANAYSGNIDTLKQRLTNGVPIIVFISIPGDTHYAVVVGYDEQSIYLVDSLVENEEIDMSSYNRKVSNEEFEKIWRTDTILTDNIYIVIDNLQ